MGFYYGETRRLNSSPHQGFNLLGQKYFEDYFLEFNGAPLDCRFAAVWIYPEHLKRQYSSAPIKQNKMSLADSIALGLAKHLNAWVVSTDHHEFDAIEKTGEVKFFWLR